VPLSLAMGAVTCTASNSVGAGCDSCATAKPGRIDNASTVRTANESLQRLETGMVRVPEIQVDMGESALWK